MMVSINEIRTSILSGVTYESFSSNSVETKSFNLLISSLSFVFHPFFFCTSFVLFDFVAFLFFCSLFYGEVASLRIKVS